MPAPPDILWIVTTQWRAQACGYAGDANARTPRIDALAARSIDFSQAVTPHPFGPFARAALLTGTLSPGNGIRDYFDPLPQGARTIAHTLGDHGYATAFFGKWHLGRRDPSESLVGEAHARMIVPPEARGGFEFWEGFESGFLLNDPWLHGTRLEQPARFKGYQSSVLCERAEDWIRSPHSSPWFCVVSLEAPHPPYDAPAPGATRPDPRKIVLPANVPLGGDAETRARRELSGYYAHIEATDRAIGALIDAAPSSAAIVFTSVHGDMHGAHGLFRKGWPYEESLRVPLLVRLPCVESARKGIRTRQAASLADIPNWTSAWAGLADPQSPECAKSQPAPDVQWISMPSAVPLPLQCDRPWRGLRIPSRKLILNEDGTPWLFFDLESDPLEMDNLVSDPARAGEIRELSRLI
ncbi:MAG: sulfatase-like hydrolase/transferase [Opitutaceae bacterium]|jgi:arylsulfatase A-like enzyme